MRFYEYECLKEGCRHQQEEFRETDKRDEPAFCEQCGEQMHRAVTLFHGIVKNPAVPRGRT